jgi:alkylation response protein AidB-like acyl-CoA dehydrogenase
MDFQLTEDQKQLQAFARTTVQNEVMPFVMKYYESGRTDPLTHEEVVALLKKLRPTKGLAGPLPKAFGGEGLSWINTGVVYEELAKTTLLPYVMPFNFLGFALMDHGTPEQQKKFLPPVMRLEKLCSFALTEQEHGSDLGALETTATLDGDSYVINGTKIFIGGGGSADYVIVIATTDKNKGKQGISMFIVDKEVSPWSTKLMNAVAFPMVSLAELTFDNCRVPKENLLGEEGKGFKYALSRLSGTRALNCVMAVGMAQAALDEAVKYAKTRKQFGKYIGQFQMVQEKIADMAAEVAAARFMAFNTLDMVDKGIYARKEACMGKFYCTEVCNRVTQSASRICGGNALLRENIVWRLLLDAILQWTPEGTNDIQRLTVAREILGLSAFV